MDKQRMGYIIMSLLCERDGLGAEYLNNPNHAVEFKWNPYGAEEPDYNEYCVLNSESPSDQVWLGNSHKWYRFYSGQQFRRMAAWVLWRWFWHDWCGLKTKLWLVGLRMR